MRTKTTTKPTVGTEVTISRETYETLLSHMEEHIYDFEGCLESGIYEDTENNAEILEEYRKAVAEEPTYTVGGLGEEDLANVICALLCDGLHYFSGYGFNIDYSEEDYVAAKKELLTEGKKPSIEDVQTRIVLNGNTIEFIDTEDGDNRYELSLETIGRRLRLAPVGHISAMMNGSYDAGTADVVMQYILFGKVIYG